MKSAHDVPLRHWTTNTARADRGDHRGRRRGPAAVDRDLIQQRSDPWFVLAGLTLVTGWSTLRMRDVPISFSIRHITIAAALLFGRPPAP